MDEIPMQVYCTVLYGVYCTVLYGVYCTVLYGVYIRVATELVPPDVISVSSHPAVLASQVHSSDYCYRRVPMLLQHEI